jgi:predicted RNA-binding Zn ribbon-like protein
VTVAEIATLPRIGGVLCLDFVNTIDPRFGPPTPTDFLVDYDSLLTWAVLTQIVDRQAAQRLRRVAREQPDEAAGVLGRAVALRESLFGVLSRTSADVDSLSAVNAELSRALANRVIERVGSELRLTWSPDGGLDRILWPIVESAAGLLTSPALRRVRTCARASCGWLFLDTSKGGRRRWCAMRDCGTREKTERRRRSSSREQREPLGARHAGS